MEEKNGEKKTGKELTYEINSGHGIGTEEFTEPPSTGTFSSSGSSRDGAKVHKDEVIKLNVKWVDF